MNNMISTKFNPSDIEINSSRIIINLKNGQRSSAWVNMDEGTNIQFFTVINEVEKSSEIYLLYHDFKKEKTIGVLKFDLSKDRLVISDNFSKNIDKNFWKNRFKCADSRVTSCEEKIFDGIPHLTIHQDGKVSFSFYGKGSDYKDRYFSKSKLPLDKINDFIRLAVIFPYKNLDMYGSVHYRKIRKGIFFNNPIDIGNVCYEVGLMPHLSSEADNYCIVAMDELIKMDKFKEQNNVVIKSNYLDYSIYIKLFLREAEHQSKEGWFLQLQDNDN